MPDSVMLFAAGFGTRMGALTKDRPKPLIEVAGKPLLEHALDFTGEIPTRVVNAHYHADQIEAYAENRDLIVSTERPDILDTGGGLRHALPLLGDGPTFTLNTDAVWHGPNPLDLLKSAWNPDVMDALLLCVPLQNAIGRKGGGDFALSEDNQLIRKGDLVYTGAQITKTEGLQHIPDAVFSLNLLWNQMAENGRLHGLTYPGKWCDVGHPDGITLAKDMVRHV
ncbi:nucleotidyltransferase family protein [Pelagimonas phthalicica]|nr:nucleotidyltransferase family protein [Pelagimonas phthalicica]